MKVFAALLFLLPVAVQAQYLRPEDCADIRNHDQTLPSGVYTIYPTATLILQVYCDMETDNGGWTVFQRRMDGSVNFYRGWDHYKAGFGSVDGEHWLGLQNIFYLTNLRKCELRVDMEDWEGRRVFAQYSHFILDPERFGYRLYVREFSDGGAGDSLSYHNKYRFSTFDNDLDDAYDFNCAEWNRGAFWFRSCYDTNPNGLYLWGRDNIGSRTGVTWNTFKGNNYSLKFFSMKIRPVSSDV